MTSRSIFPAAAWEPRSILEAMAQISVIDEEVSNTVTVESRLSQVAPRNSQLGDLEMKPRSENIRNHDIFLIYLENVGKRRKNYEWIIQRNLWISGVHMLRACIVSSGADGCRTSQSQCQKQSRNLEALQNLETEIINISLSYHWYFINISLIFHG